MKRTVKRFAIKGMQAIANAVELVLIDLVYGKGKYRRRGAKLRPIIHRTYNKTVIVREPAPIVYTVKSKKEQ